MDPDVEWLGDEADEVFPPLDFSAPGGVCWYDELDVEDGVEHD